MQGTGNTRSIPQRMVVDVTSGAVTTDKIAREKELCKKEEIKTSKRRGQVGQTCELWQYFILLNTVYHEIKIRKKGMET